MNPGLLSFMAPVDVASSIWQALRRGGARVADAQRHHAVPPQGKGRILNPKP